MRFAFVSAMIACAASPVIASTPLTGFWNSVDYFTVTAGGSGDFNTYCCTDVRTDMVLGTLGPNGLPVLNPASTGPQSFTGVDGVTGELQWWTVGVTNGGDTVTSTGTDTFIPFPTSINAFFPPNGTGSSNANGFQTAVFRSTLNVSQPWLVTFNLAADDDAFLFVDGKLFTGIGGVHGITAAPTVTRRFNPGTYELLLFYADRHVTDAKLNISGTFAVVPEPGTWAMLIAGFGLVGFAARRRRTVSA